MYRLKFYDIFLLVSFILSVWVLLNFYRSDVNSVVMVFMTFSCRSLSFDHRFIELRNGLSLFADVIGLMSDENTVKSSA